MRQTATSRTVMAGCWQCNGAMKLWDGPNAQGVAARHHDATGHTTWVDVVMMVRYGSRPEEGVTEERGTGPRAVY